MRLLTSYQFRQKAGRTHGLRYVYDLVDYKGSKSKVLIICPIHGVFQQVAADHLRGYGCDACRRKVLSERRKATEEGSAEARPAEPVVRDPSGSQEPLGSQGSPARPGPQAAGSG